MYNVSPQCIMYLLKFLMKLEFLIMKMYCMFYHKDMISIN